ncbi:hypothetical protein [Bradyrhizobium elkanii]|uniref:hypothetical protein n=1 Tax=Bradyrhizobium elkanii TaxID=29448 RepID=UPI002168BCDC|nr:hypothetical protein [Bradyrhizobium elkanii]MCS3521847.1 hypothetical protein [Bradyrhizobium elkanii]MCS4069502.1 hypothetical protein [Bradyrhizobium elkanii]MCS4076132.1 hypothetical protein [Bradyrhizobium elkanii]MDH6687736.1 hypothetical protein [Bradyrhizobium elkanii]
MPRKKQPAAAVARPAGLKFSADGIAARVFIPRQLGKGHDAIELRKNPKAKSKRGWLVQFNQFPRFSIKERQLQSLPRFCIVATCQLSHRGCHLDHFLPKIRDLPKSDWREIIEHLIAALEQGGAK